MPQIGTVFQTTIAIQVPNDPALIGAQVFHQWLLRISTVLRICQPTTYLYFSNAGVAQFGT